MSRGKTNLFKVIYNKDNQERYVLVAAFKKDQAVKRVSEILNIHIGLITEALEVNTGISELILSTEIIDLLLEKNCRQYMNFIQANQGSYLTDQNLRNLEKAKIKLKE
jgi:hypothetical protein